MALLRGHSLREIAQERETSINSVRTLLYQAFAKTETRRQSDLVRLVLPLVSMQSIVIGFMAAKGFGSSADGLHQQTDDKLPEAPLPEFRRLAASEMSTMISVLAPGASTSKHYASGHEIVYVQEGLLGMEIGEDSRTLSAGEVVYIAPQVIHRAFNPSKTEPLKVTVVYVKEMGEPHRVNLQ